MGSGGEGRRLDWSSLEQIERCRDMPTLSALFACVIAPHGYTASACGAFQPTERGPEPVFFFLNWPAEWMQLYQARNFVAHDFAVAEARRRIAPHTWLEAKSERTISAGEAALWDAALEFGWSDGFSVPIHGPGGYFALVTMAGNKRDLPVELRAWLHVLAFATHERARKLHGLDPHRAPREPLTSRELECLRWVGAGKSDREIGDILGISRTTVKYHLERARAKLGVQTRTQAIARLLLWGET